MRLSEATAHFCSYFVRCGFELDDSALDKGLLIFARDNSDAEMLGLARKLWSESRANYDYGRWPRFFMDGPHVKYGRVWVAVRFES